MTEIAAEKNSTILFPMPLDLLMGPDTLQRADRAEKIVAQVAAAQQMLDHGPDSHRNRGF